MILLLEIRRDHEGLCVSCTGLNGLNGSGELQQDIRTGRLGGFLLFLLRFLFLVVTPPEAANTSSNAADRCFGGILGVGHLVKAHLLNEAELAVLVVDEYQGRGLGSELAKRLIEIARSEKLDRVTMEILGWNHPMLEVSNALGFQVRSTSDGVVSAELQL